MSIDVFRCDYCGEITELAKAVTFWTQADELPDGRQLHIPAVYCSPYCGRTATAQSGSGRG